MIYLYDNALVEDLNKSFNPDIGEPVVKVVSPDHILEIASQIKEDKVTFPLVALERPDSIEVNTSLANFARMHRGVPAVIDKSDNNIYHEKAIPINLSYILTILTTNQADMDEILRELIFKYTSMYFLSITIPYEGKRDISFGVIIDQGTGIQKKSGLSEYTETGQLYRSSILLRCEGCVLVHYTPVQLRRMLVASEVR